MTRRFLVILPLVLTFVVLGARVPLTFATPNVGATKVDSLVNDVDSDNEADPGDTLKYTITISNTGNMDATDVLFSDLIDFNTTLVPGSLQTTPLARDDEYATTGNVSMTVVAAQGVLANDDDPDGDTLTIISVEGAAANIGMATATFHGGSVTLSLDGGFTYNPPVGFEGLDTFAYELEDDDLNTDSAAVFIAVTDMIWFVDAANTTCSPACDGRLGSPFNCLVGTGCFDPVAMDDPGDIIFVDAGAYTGGLTLLDSQQLVGDGSSDNLASVTGITLSADSDSLPSFTGTNPNVTSSGDTVIVGQNNTIRGLTLTNTDGTGIRGTSVATLVVSETTIVGGGGMSINGGVLDVSLQALYANSTSDEGISLTTVSGTFSISDLSGTITVDGHAAVDILGTGTGLLVTAEFASLTSTNSAGRGIRLSNLTTGSSFHGGLASVTASTVDGLVLNNNTGSAFTFADMDIDNSSTNQRGIFADNSGTLTISAGDINGGSGRGVDIDGTHLNVTLDSVTSVGGTTAGIDLNSTTGTFAVIGDGTDTSVGGNASGGTISNKTGNDGSNNGIGVLLNNAHGVSLARIQLNDFTNFAIKGDTVTGFNLTNSTIDGTNGNSLGADEGSITLVDLLGTSTITDSEISGGHQCNILVDNSSATLMSLTITGTTIGTTGPSGQDGMLFRGTSSADMTLDISNSFFTAAPGDLLNTTVLDTATMDVTLNNIAFSNNHPSIASAGGGVTITGGGSGSAVSFTYDITNNTFRDAKGIALNLFKGTGAGSFSGTISGNTIGISGVLLSGSSQASALQVTSHGTGSHVTLIDDNNFYGYNENGILLRANDGSSTLNATLTRNTLANPGANVFAGIVIEPGAQSSDTNVICADVGGGASVENSFVGSGNGDFPFADFVSATSSSATLNMPGLAGGVGGVAAYIQGRNAGTPTVFADGNHGAAPCSTPLKAARGQGISWDGYLLSYDEFDAVVEEALRRWASTKLTADQANLLERVTFGIEDLPEGTLGKSRETHVVIDISGAGYGWFVDSSPKDQREFVVTAYKTTLFARPKEDSADRMDLLTVIMHEIGHVLGKEHATGQRELMTSTLDTGVRRVLGTTNASPKKVRSTAGESRELRSDRLDVQEHDLVDALAEMVSEDISNANALEAILMPVETPDGNSPVEVSNTSGGGIASGETVQVAIGTLAPGKDVTITFDVIVNGSIPSGTTEICNQGTVSSSAKPISFPDEPTDDPSEIGVDNPTCTDVDVDTSDFAITKDDGQTVAVPGMMVTYTIVVTNNGPDDATGATVSDTFPPALSCSTTCVASAGSSCAAGTISGNISDSVDLLNGGTATYTAVCSISASATGSLSNTAIVTPPADRNDPDTSDNSDTDVDTLSPKADLSIDKEDDADPVTAGDNIVYTITVENLGPSDATGVSVSDTLPASVVFFETVGCVEDPNGVPTCTLGNIAAGGSVFYTVEVVTSDPASIGTIMNTASVSSTTTDPISNNDSDTESTTVSPTNQPPTAACVPLSAEADSSCCVTVDVASIDNGSADPNGPGDVDTLCITAVDGVGVGCRQSIQLCDDGSFNTHSVTLTITDLQGESDSCDAAVEVIDDADPTSVCNAVGGVAETNCEYVLPFSATIDDNCCVNLSDVTVNVTLLTGDATLGAPLIAKVLSNNGRRIEVTGTVLVSDLTNCPATVQVTVDAVDCWGNSAIQCAVTADVADNVAPEIVCPPPVTLDRGDRLCNDDVQDWLDSATATDNCDPDVDIVNDVPDGGFPFDSTKTVIWTATDDCNNSSQCSSTITIGSSDRIAASKKGSLLIYSKVDLRWGTDGRLLQDTVLEITNDFPADVYVQMYFINGDEPRDPIFALDPPVMVAEGEPGWNWVDCQTLLTSNQPKYWSASSGSPLGCQPFTILDPDSGNGPGRLDPESQDGGRVLRGYVLAWAVDAQGHPIRWNHLSGAATIVNYGAQAAWEYNAWAAQHSACGFTMPKELLPFGRGERLHEEATTDVWALGNYAYIGTFDDPCGDGTGLNGSGVRVFDVSEPSSPVEVGAIPSPSGSKAADVKVATMNGGDLLVHSNEPCSGGPGGFEIWSVDDPLVPVHQASVRIDELNPISDFLFGGLTDLGVQNLFLFRSGSSDYVAAVATGAFDTLRIYDITNPTTPTMIGAWGAEEIFDPGVGEETVDFNRVLDASFWLIDGFGASQSRFLRDVTVSADGTRAYLSHWDAGLVLLDISDPTDPSLISVALDPVNGSPDGEVTSHSAWPNEDGSVVVETEDDLSAWEASIAPSNLTFGNDPANVIPGTAISTLSGDAFEGSPTGNAGVVDTTSVAVISGPLSGQSYLAVELDGDQPQLIDVGPVAGSFVWIGRACQGDTLANSLSAGDIAVVRRGVCTFAEKLNTAATNGAAAIVIANNRDLSTPWGGVRIWDYADPANPVLASTFETMCSASTVPGGSCDASGQYSAHTVMVEQDKAYISWRSDGVLIVDISDPYNPREIARFNGAGPDFELQNGGIQDVWGIYKAPGEPRLYASDRNGGLYVFHLENGLDGRIGFDGVTYDAGLDVLLMDFYASGSTALSGGGFIASSDTDLTLHPISADLRQDNRGPVTTKAHFDIWNGNEQRFSGTHRCITCWDQTLLSRYDAPNHFLMGFLGTDRGKARIDGQRSDVCDDDCVRADLDVTGTDRGVCSYDASLIGVVAKVLEFSGPVTGRRAMSGRSLVGAGTQSAEILYDIISPPGTLRDDAREAAGLIRSDNPTRVRGAKGTVDRSDASRTVELQDVQE